jgi:hypothetical protein
MAVYLDISSFVGFSPEAVHVYGKLIRPSSSMEKYAVVELEYKLTRSQAERRNILHFKQYPGDKYKPYREGSITNGFDTEQDLIDFAMEHWKEYFPNERLLICGSPSRVTPQPILSGATKRIREQSQRLFKQVEDLYGDKTEPSSWKKYDALSKKWDEIIRRIDIA